MSKPQQILELERAYGVELEQRDQLHWNDNAYKLDERGEVVGLALNDRVVRDASPLSSFGSLTELYLVGNELSDVSPLAALTQLTSLDLARNKLIDASPLAALTQLTSLDMSYNELSDASPLAALTQLTSLGLADNGLSDASPLAALTQLTSLDLMNNKLIDASPLAALTQLTGLDLAGNELIDASPLVALRQLASLDLSRNELIDDSPLAALTQLTSLGLSDNGLSDASSLAALTQLTSLDLARNKLIDASPLAALTQLTSLDMSYNELSDASPLAALTQLTSLALSDNKLSDASPLVALTQLTSLDLSYNKLIDVSPLAALTQLTSLDLMFNQIRALPAELLRLPLRWRASGYGLHGFHDLLLEGNPLQQPPLEVIEEGQEAIELYYQQLATSEKQLREAKLILLGEPDAGKSSIVRRLIHNKFDPKSDTTLGTDIHRWGFAANDGEHCRVNIWDFGGQDIQQSIHHLFLTAEALYLVVLDARRDESALPWLQTIKAFAPGSTVLVAVNQYDVNKHPKVNEQELRSAYPGIVDFFYTSCKAEGDSELARLFQELQRHLQQLPSMGKTYPGQWFEVKERLERQQQGGQHYMSMPDYRRLCAKHKMTADKAETLLSVLDRVGTVRWFRNFEYANYQVLDPSWLTVGLYNILIDGGIKDRGGEVNRAQIQAILLGIESEQGYSYQDEDVSFFIEAIQYYKFAFKVERGNAPPCYRVPKGFRQKVPEGLDLEHYKGAAYRQYELEFKSFAPSWLVHRPLVSLASRGAATIESGIPDGSYWFYGFVCRSAEGKALVQLHEHERKLFISVPKNSPNLYAQLRGCLFMAFADTMELEMQEWLLFGPDNKSRASLQQLRRYAAKGIEQYVDNDTLEPAQVADLLGLFPQNVANIDSAAALAQLQRLQAKLQNERQSDRQQNSERIAELEALLRQLQEQNSAPEQISIAKQIKQKLEWLNTIAQSSESAQTMVLILKTTLKGIVDLFS